MIAVIFEVELAAGREAEYLDTAASLCGTLETMDGFLSIERFQSLSQVNKLLSLSFWRDEASVKRWREVQNHREAQTRGRSGVFENYRLRVAGVIRDYGMLDREAAPVDSRAHHG